MEPGWSGDWDQRAEPDSAHRRIDAGRSLGAGEGERAMCGCDWRGGESRYLDGGDSDGQRSERRGGLRRPTGQLCHGGRRHWALQLSMDDGWERSGGRRAKPYGGHRWAPPGRALRRGRDPGSMWIVDYQPRDLEAAERVRIQRTGIRGRVPWG